MFPPSEIGSWNPNAFNADEEREYTFEDVHQERFGFDSTASVIQEEDSNLIVRRFSEEVFAKHVGLIHKEWYHIETQFAVDSGLHWIQHLTSSSFGEPGQ